MSQEAREARETWGAARGTRNVVIMAERWQEVGADVFVRRHQSFDLNVGLVVGDGGCLVVDTRATHGQAHDLVEAIRTVTPHPWTVVNTHNHFDHCFGNRVFRPAEIWAHQRCADGLRRLGETQRAVVRARRAGGRTHLATELADVVIDPPDRVFTDSTDLVVGGRLIALRYLGRGHTDHDIVAMVPDADVIFTGDLVEEGAPPSFDDSFPLNWPATVAGLLPMGRAAFVPGHGAVVDRDFVERQGGDLEETAERRGSRMPRGGPPTRRGASCPSPSPPRGRRWPAPTSSSTIRRRPPRRAEPRGSGDPTSYSCSDLTSRNSCSP